MNDSTSQKAAALKLLDRVTVQENLGEQMEIEGRVNSITGKDCVPALEDDQKSVAAAVADTGIKKTG